MEERESIVIPTIWAEGENTNTFASAYHANESAFASSSAAETVSADQSEATSEFARRRPEEKAADSSSETQTLSDHLNEIDNDTREAREAQRWGKQNTAELADLLNCDTEDLEHLPKSIRAYPAPTITKVLDDLGMTLADLTAEPFKIDYLEAALKEETARAEELELEQVRQSLSEEDQEETTDEDEEDSDEGEEDSEVGEEQTEDEQKPQEDAEQLPTELPATLAEMSPEQRADMEKHLGDVCQVALKANHPAYVEYAGAALAEVLDIEPEHRSKFQDAAKVLTVFGENMLQSRVPDLARSAVLEALPQMLEIVMPGGAELFRRAQVANTWSSVLEQDEFKDLNLPRWGTPAFSEAAERVHTANPWLTDFDPRGQDGRPLPIAEALRVKAAVTARLLAGDRTSPKRMMEQVTAAFNKGKQEAERTTRRVSAARALKGGRGTGQIASRESYLSLLDAHKLHGGGGSFDEE